MSFSFGQSSRDKLSTCHPALRRVMEEAIKGPMDFTILCGHRTKEEQDKACAGGFSKVAFPNSKHNSFPSVAVDIAPYPIDWNDTERFRALHRHIADTAARLGVSLRWGGDFNMNGLPDDKFIDLPHYELIGG